MIFILETMVNDRNIRDILPLMGFDYFDFIILADHSGWLAVLWNNGEIHASVLRKEPRAIHMLVYETKKAQNAIISGVYAPARQNEKDLFWNHLVDWCEIVDVPWCVIGDMNELVNANEKRGGQIYANPKF